MSDVRNYITVTSAYWVFTLTDGALRMLVLLYLHESGYTPIQIASLFLFYEFFGVVTNLVGGWLAARFGLRATLFGGLGLQILALGVLALSGLGVLAGSLTMPVVMVAQALSGVAKDLTKMSSKSFIKFVVPAGRSDRMLRWVAWLTGSKNALKGGGFFLGGVLLSTVGFAAACYGMAAMLAVVLVVAALSLPGAMGRSGGSRFRSLFSHAPAIQWLSAARFFLFGSRDVWFVLALPIYLSAELQWSHGEVGGFLALWVIGYGIVQAFAPAYVKPDHRLWLWTGLLVLPLAGILVALQMQWSPLWSMVLGLGVFGAVFASNSALHSYLIIAHSEGDRVAVNVGFYYMANAAGRLVGTLLSGVLFQLGSEGQAGLQVCVVGSLVFVLLSLVSAVPLSQMRLEQRCS